MPEKIASSSRPCGLAGLKKAITKLKIERIGYVGGLVDYPTVLRLIGKFEAGLMENNLTDEEMKLLEGWCIGTTETIHSEDCRKLKVVIKKCKKLRRILSGDPSGEGGETAAGGRGDE